MLVLKDAFFSRVKSAQKPSIMMWKCRLGLALQRQSGMIALPCISFVYADLTTRPSGLPDSPFFA
jgi:hypothetical protein